MLQEMCVICHKRKARVCYTDERRHMHNLEICYGCWARHLWLYYQWATRMIEHALERDAECKE
jgi:hypothetical protein